jgi:hypothetical protein
MNVNNIQNKRSVISGNVNINKILIGNTTKSWNTGWVVRKIKSVNIVRSVRESVIVNVLN